MKNKTIDVKFEEMNGRDLNVLRERAYEDNSFYNPEIRRDLVIDSAYRMKGIESYCPYSIVSLGSFKGGNFFGLSDNPKEAEKVSIVFLERDSLATRLRKVSRPVRKEFGSPLYIELGNDDETIQFGTALPVFQMQGVSL